MEVKIGVTHATRELTLETDATNNDVLAAVEAAVGGKTSVLQLTDDKGRTVLVPVEKLAYVEVTDDSGRRVGFGS